MNVFIYNVEVELVNTNYLILMFIWWSFSFPQAISTGKMRAKITHVHHNKTQESLIPIHILCNVLSDLRQISPIIFYL